MPDNLKVVICLITIMLTFLTSVILWIKLRKNKTPTCTVGNVNLKMNEFTFELIKNENTKSYKSEIENQPVVTVDANSNQCFVFIKVDKFGKCDGGTVVEYDSKNWKLLDGTSNVYYTYVNEIEAEKGKELPALFKIKEPQREYIDYFEDIKDGASLNLSAYAIQTNGFLDASDAWINVNIL